MRLAHVLVASLAAALTTGCGASSTATSPANPAPRTATAATPASARPRTATASPSDTPSPVATTVTLGWADHGRPVALRRGALVLVRLAGADAGRGRWNLPVSSDDAVAHRLDAGADADGSVHATFRASGAGTAQLVADQTMPSCTPACGGAQRRWSVTVTVSSA